MTVDVERVLAIVGQLVFIAGGIVGGFLWLKKWLREQVADPAKSASAAATSAAAALAPNGGHSTHDYARQAAESSADVVRRLDTLERRVENVAQLAHEAHALSAIASKRVDDFLYRALPRQEAQSDQHH